MAVYTKLTFDEISDHLKQYDIGELIDFKEIVAGIDNSNFIIQTSQDKFILTIFEKRIKPEELPFFIELKLYLAKNEVCCPEPILNKNGQSISDLKSKKSAICSFLSGKTLEPREDGFYETIKVSHCQEVGEALARLHLAARGFDQNRKNDLSYDGFRPLFNKFEKLLDDYQIGLKQEIIEAIDFVEKNWRHDLKKEACHLDLFPDNVFFDDDGKLSGVIDFYFAANELLVFDFASLVNGWCFDEFNKFDEEKFEAMKKSYEKVRKFEESELEFMNVALFAAALRFLLTRLHDMFFTPVGSVVNVKDPQEYIERIRKWRGFLEG